MIITDQNRIAQALGVPASQVSRLEQMDHGQRQAWGKPPVCRTCGGEAKTRCYVVEWWTLRPTAVPDIFLRRKHLGFACQKCVEGGPEE